MREIFGGFVWELGIRGQVSARSELGGCGGGFERRESEDEEREEDEESANGDCGLGFGDEVIRIGASQRTIDGGFEGI